MQVSSFYDKKKRESTACALTCHIQGIKEYAEAMWQTENT
jgi:hypothetical protein